MASGSQQQSQTPSNSSANTNVRTKTDIGWDYASVVIDERGKKHAYLTFVKN